MRILLTLFIVAVAAAAVGGDEVDQGLEVHATPAENLADGLDCPGTTLLSHDDDGFENRVAWTGAGVAPPDYGAWAECYDSQYICGIQFVFTADYQLSNTMDVYVWEAVAGDDPRAGPDPGNVICIEFAVSPWPIAIWPEVSIHNVRVCCGFDGEHFVGYWGNWPGETNGWYTTVDVDGPATGCPRTKAAGPDPGWEHPEKHFGAIHGLGIREYAGFSNCIEPIEKTTWGRIKTLYQ